MPIIDADTHVDETEDTWEYLAPGEQRFKPEYYVSKNYDPARGPGYYWIFSGKRQRRRVQFTPRHRLADWISARPGHRSAARSRMAAPEWTHGQRHLEFRDLLASQSRR